MIHLRHRWVDQKLFRFGNISVMLLFHVHQWTTSRNNIIWRSVFCSKFLPLLLSMSMDHSVQSVLNGQAEARSLSHAQLLNLAEFLLAQSRTSKFILVSSSTSPDSISTADTAQSESEAKPSETANLSIAPTLAESTDLFSTGSAGLCASQMQSWETLQLCGGLILRKFAETKNFLIDTISSPPGSKDAKHPCTCLDLCRCSSSIIINWKVDFLCSTIERWDCSIRGQVEAGKETTAATLWTPQMPSQTHCPAVWSLMKPEMERAGRCRWPCVCFFHSITYLGWNYYGLAAQDHVEATIEVRLSWFVPVLFQQPACSSFFLSPQSQKGWTVQGTDQILPHRESWAVWLRSLRSHWPWCKRNGSS